jgi:CheY-like chemotaxis protein
VDSLLPHIDAPAAIVSATGHLASRNDAFARWSGLAPHGPADAHVLIHAGRGLLMLGGGRQLGLTVTPLVGGGWLATPAPPNVATLPTLARALSQALAEVEQTVRTHAHAALEEAPDAEVAAGLRQVLAAADDLARIGHNVTALTGDANVVRQPVALPGLLHAVAGAVPAACIRIDAGGDEAIAELDVSRAFAHLVELVGSLSDPQGADPLVLRAVQAGSCARIEVEGLTPAAAQVGEPALNAMTTFVTAHGGTLLRAAGRLTLDFPAYAPPVPATADPGTVLVADDDEATLALMSATLRRAGWTVLEADNGIKASALLRTHADSLAAVVADAVLPGRGGTELASEARRVWPNLPFLLVSGHPTDVLGDPTAVPVLAKPFAPSEFVRRLSALVRVAHP